MNAVKYSESDIIDIMKRLIGVRSDADLVEYLNSRYSERVISRQSLSNYRSKEGKKFTITKVFLLELVQHLETIRCEGSRQPELQAEQSPPPPQDPQ